MKHKKGHTKDDRKMTRVYLGIVYGNKCIITGDEQNVTVHHIHKKSLGGEWSTGNCALLSRKFHDWINKLEITNKAFYLTINESIQLIKEARSSQEPSDRVTTEYIRRLVKSFYEETIETGITV